MTLSTLNIRQSPFLALPPEIRSQIYTAIFSRAVALTLRSLFIRKHYLNTFMTQQPKDLCPQILLVCHQITSEALPILYSLPTWHSPCRLDALSVQIGRTNFSYIKTMTIDVDDLNILVESCRHHHHQQPSPPQQTSPSSLPHQLPSQHLPFTNLTTLNLEGYQSSALSSTGTHRIRLEALRLLSLASHLQTTHPNLKTLLQRPPKHQGADAQDLSLGRVRWQFVSGSHHHYHRQRDDYRARGIGTGDGSSGVNERDHEHGYENEHVVDIPLVRSILESILHEEEGVTAIRESSLPVAWTSSPGGRFSLYPYLTRTGGAAADR